MKIRNHTLLAATLFALISGAATAKEIKVEASAAAEQVFIGESVRLTVKVHGFKSGMDPDLSAIKGCIVEYIGHGDQSFHNISIINGRRQVTGFSGRVFEYDITPESPGRRQLGPITVTGKKAKATIAGPIISVRGVEPQNHVLLLLETSATEVIVDEPFSVDLRVLVQALKPPYADTSPLPVERPPHLRIPYLKQDTFENLEGPDVSKLLNSMLVNNRRSPGLTINDVTVDSGPFGGFFGMGSLGTRDPAAKFSLNPKRIQHEGKPYFEHTLSLTYVPTAEGLHRFGPVAFKGQVFTGVTAGGQGVTASIFAVADQETVNVVPPPEFGRPASYVGAIGRSLSVRSSLDAQTCNVGDPLTLEISIAGDIRLKNLIAPRIGLQEDLATHFRIYEDTIHSETRGESRVYQYTVRPSRAGTLEFPPVAVSFYNTQSREYETVMTAPIPVRANKATEVEGSIVIDTAEQSVTIVTASEKPNFAVPAPFALPAALTHRERLFSPALHIPLLLLGPLLVLVGSGLRWLRRLMPGAAKRRRKAAAAEKAIARIKVTPELASRSGVAGRQEMVEALREYVSARLDVDATALTPRELFAILLRHEVTHPLAQAYVDLLERNFNAGFQAGEQSAREIETDAEAACEVVARIEEELLLREEPQHGGAFSSVKRWLATWAVALLLVPAALAATPSTQFEAQLAMSQISTADTPDAFDRSARALERILDMGGCNAALLYNYGTALLMADHPAAALRALIRAERYSGTTWELKRNMRLAIRDIADGVSDPGLPWYRVPLFWHYGIPGRTRITIASLAFLLVWLSILLRQAGIKETSRTILTVALVLLILFGSSAATTLYQELRPNHAIADRALSDVGSQPLEESP
jgi:hypothetical protein